uniref:Phenylalanine--tRNA ligase beta subunit n=1 Tax=Bangia fuscopurpurea TaxID=101920 RepID=A0A0F6VXL7_BANFU|nr:phenylalanyl-tRNA synthetase beta chain [Bangia fuscopurpurea]
MKVSLNWLKELVNIESINSNQLANQLTQAGFEVEDVEIIQIDNQVDYIMDVSSTANRSDALSMIGLSREVAALLKTSMINDAHSSLKRDVFKQDNVINDSALQNCDYYLSAVFDNIKMQESPKWLKNRLQSSGFTSKNLVIDISNYIMLKWGQPLNIIDFNKIIGSDSLINISSCFCSNKEEYIEFEGNNVLLNEDVFITQINNRISGLAGIGINNKFDISEKTESIFLETAIFNQSIVRKSSRVVGIRTESSIRQERGLTADNCRNAYIEALSLLKELTGGSIKETFSKDENNKSIHFIDVSFVKIQQILGQIKDNNTTRFLTVEEIIVALQSLCFNVKKKNKTFLSVCVPHYRKKDVFREIDVIEEIARIYGYDKFDSFIPVVQFTKKRSRKRKFIDKSRSILRHLGLTELVHYSLVRSKGVIKLNNPLIQDYSTLRCSLLEGLIQANIHNVKQSSQNIDSFEIGTVFDICHDKISEKTKLAIILGGNLDIRSEWSTPAHSLNWYEAKGIVENFFYKIDKIIKWEKRKFIDNYQNLILSNKSAALIYKGQTIGLFGELNPSTFIKLGLNTKLFVLEIDINMLDNNQNELSYLNYQVKPYSKYPSVTRDLSIIIPQSMEVSCLLALLDQFDDHDLEETKLFDQYISKSLGSNKKSIGLRFMYRSNHKTLTNLEIDNKQNQLQEKIVKQLNLEIRK